MSNSLRLAAKSGDIKALEGLMNQSFQSKGITVRVTNKGSTLQVLMRGSKPPEKQFATLIKQGIKNISPQGFEQVLVTAKVIHGDISWTDKWDLEDSETIEYLILKSAEEISLSADETHSIDTNISPMQAQITQPKTNSQHTRKAYQFIQVRVQLLGRGMTNEIMNLYVNGKRLKPKVKTINEFLNFLGAQGFSVVTAAMETEGVYTHFYTLQREVFTYEAPSEDIYDTLEKSKEGADFGDSIRNMLEFGLFDNF